MTINGGVYIKHIPNIITAARIILSALMIFTVPLSPVFFVIYILCGISDVTDGYLARRLGCATTPGARLDSIADVIMTAVLLYLFLPLIELKKWMIISICTIAVIKLTSFVIGAVKFRYTAFLHTYASKITGMLFFLFPFIFGYAETAAIAIICAAAGVSAIDEAAIIIFAKELHENEKSFFHDRLSIEVQQN